MRTAVLLLLFVSLLATPAAPQGKKSEACSVRGRVVNDAGAPVPNAPVLVDAGPPTTWEDLITLTLQMDRGNRPRGA